MAILRHISGKPIHSAVPTLCDQLAKGRIGRRDFLRTVTLLGVSAASATAFVGGLFGETPAAQAAEAAPKQGGVLRFACAIQDIKDPALITWIEASNLIRNSLEFLTEVGADNITRPYLAESWQPSEDLTTWHFTLRKGITWSNGDAFTTADVAHNFRRWTAADSKSVNKTSFAAVREVEIINDHEFRLHLTRPILAIPEMLYAFTCAIVHRDFDATGGDWVKNPIGTGPYALKDYQHSRSATFTRRDGYWGRPAHLDQIRYIDTGTDVATQVAALAAGQVDVLYRLTVAELDLVKRLPSVKLLSEDSAQTIVMRMQVDQKPFDDVRVRRALVLSADNQRMLDVAYRGLGTVAENHHVAPFQPEYAHRPPVQRNVAEAKRLLAEAGYPNGLDVTLTLGNTQGKWEQDAAQILQQNCAEAGIRIVLNVLPAAQYWPVWNKAPFSLTYWAHRPLGVMTLDLAYRSGAAWNESRFSNPEFDAALDHAMGIIDPQARAQAMETVERILQEQAVFVQPFWARNFTATASKVQGHKAHPAHYYRMDGVWLS